MIFKKKQNISTLNEVLKLSWKLLHDGVRDFRNPFHQSTLATINGNNPQARIVILREFSEKDRTLICHCDARSPKVLQIRDNFHVTWLFYDPARWLQLRLSGVASVHTDDSMAESQWEKVNLSHRMNYCAEMAPGSPTEKPTSGLPDLLGRKAPKLFTESGGRKNFAAIVCKFDEMDWLLLRLTGHMRAQFHWKDDRLDASWVIP